MRSSLLDRPTVRGLRGVPWQSARLSMLMLAGKKISQSTLACSVVKVPKRREAAPACERRGAAPGARTRSPRRSVHTAGARLEACVRMCVVSERHRVRGTQPLHLRSGESGGAGGTRTPYLRLAKAALSRVSYGPSVTSRRAWERSVRGSLVRRTASEGQLPRTDGGPSWTRTRDLSLIRTAL